MYILHMQMQIRIHIHIHIHIQVQISMYMCKRRRICISHVFVHDCIKFSHRHPHVCLWVCLWWSTLSMHTLTHIQAHINKQFNQQMNIYIYKYVYIYTHVLHPPATHLCEWNALVLLFVLCSNEESVRSNFWFFWLKFPSLLFVFLGGKPTFCVALVPVCVCEWNL